MSHDPTSAWAIVFAYFAAVCVALRCAHRSGGDRQSRRFWLLAAATLLLLGLNKQLDLQTYLTTWGRDLARQDGWYEQRRLVQLAFLAALAAGAAAIALVGAWALRGAPRSVWAAAAGLGLLAVFVLARAATFHHIDLWVNVELAGLRRGRWLELAGILVVAASTLAFLRRPDRDRSLTSEALSG
jgi:hypothetical protein